MGAGPSLLGVRCLFSRWAECQPPKKATQLFHHPWVINSCKPQGYRALPQSWEPFVGKCTWAFTPSSPWSPQSLTSSRKIWHAEERLCMTALLHLHRLCEHREPVIIQDLSAPIPERVSSHHSADTGTGLLLNVNRLLGVASPHFLCLPHFLCPHFHVFYLALLQRPHRPVWKLGARDSLPTSHSIQCRGRGLPILPLPAGDVRYTLSSKASLWKHLGECLHFFREIHGRVSSEYLIFPHNYSQ